MKAYYESHESAYQQIKSKGFIGWGNVKTLNELGDKRTNEYLTSLVTQFYPTTQSQKALDLGCGTGTTAFVLSKLGFSVTGIDISETAIQMGRDLAKQQNLDIQFVIDDLLKIKNLREKFDLIYDSHCLHCIVFDEDRKKAFSEIRKLLNPSGLFILDTMVMPPDENFDFTGGVESLKFDDQYILWHKTRPSSDYGVVEVDGQHWCAQRRLYPSDLVLKEVKQAGFKIVSELIEAQDKKPSMLRVVLK